MGGGGGSSQDFAAGNVFAQVAREQYDLGRKLGDPLEMQLRNSIGGATLPETMMYVDESVGKAFGGQRAALGLDASRRGVTIDGATGQMIDRTLGLNQASTTVGLKNAGRLAVRDRDQEILGGGIGANRVASAMAGAR